LNYPSYQTFTGKPDAKKTVIMACTQPYWSVLQVGSQHLARQFGGDGWKVYYISSPISPLHLPVLFRTEVMQRYLHACKGISAHENGGIFSCIPFASVVPAACPFLNNMPVARNWYKSMIPPLHRLKKRINPEKADLLYIDNLFYHFLLDHLSYEKSVFRVMDIHEEFPGWKGKASQLAAKIAQKTDLTAYSALGLEEYVRKLAPKNSTFIPNGVDYRIFNNHDQTTGQKHPRLNSIPDPIILYTGLIDTRMDIPLVKKVAEINPDISFVFAGPVKKADKLSGLANNVFCPGPVPHEELPLLMKGAKAGMIPFDVNNQMGHIQGIRSLKLFEYMAAGLPVITARWPEIQALDSPAWIYDNVDEFSQLINKAVQNNIDPEPLKDFAKQHDWQQSYKKLLNTL